MLGQYLEIGHNHFLLHIFQFTAQPIIKKLRASESDSEATRDRETPICVFQKMAIRNMTIKT
jgi:hypothetical protein